MRLPITLVLSLFSIVVIAKPHHVSWYSVKDTVAPTSFKIENTDEKNLVISQSDRDYLNTIEADFAADLNQSLLYNNYTTNNEAYINYVDENILKQRLDALGNKTPLDVSYSPIVKAYIDKHLKMGHYMGKVMGLAEFYFPLFEDKLAKYDIPLEIKYLAIVESHLNPRAGSNKGAIGLWQFIITTGKQYELEINSYVDERMDPIKSTEAACKFLARYYKQYGDWYLALAAYNCGPGNVNKAIIRSGGQKNYWNVRAHLPKETQGYVPTFIAMYYMFEYADKHNMKPNRLDMSMNDTDTVWVRKKLSFKEITNHTSIPIEKIQLLNPQYKLDFIPYSSTKQYVLRLPQKFVSRFVSAEKQIYASTEQAEIAKKQPAVSAGETFSSLTALAEKTPPPLSTTAKSANTQNQTNVSPPNTEKSTSTTNANTTKVNNTPKGKKQSYTVKRGDYLALIASKYGVTKEDVMNWNKLNSQSLVVGQSLVIYSDKIPTVAPKVLQTPPTTKVTPTETQKTTSTKPSVAETKPKLPSNKPKQIYTVKAGESIGLIANKFKVSSNDVKEWNNLKSLLVFTGQKLIIYSDVKLPLTNNKTTTTATATKKEIEKKDTPKKSTTVSHTIKQGETLSSLSRKYGVSVEEIKKQNNLKTDNLKLNQKLIIKK